MAKNINRDMAYRILRKTMSVQEILDWQVPDTMQMHAEDLLNKNNAGTITSVEQAELESYRQLDAVLTIMTLKARLELQEREA